MEKIKFTSQIIKSSISVDSERTYLYAKFEGEYPVGSLGNGEGMFIFSKISAAYFLFDTIVNIIVDLSDLEYKKGNTLLKAINFFEEIGRDLEEKDKKVIVISSSSNYESIKSLKGMTKNKNIILESDLNTAILIAKKDIEEFFK